jgi:lysophospholipase L1-like esterase
MRLLVVSAFSAIALLGQGCGSGEDGGVSGSGGHAGTGGATGGAGMMGTAGAGGTAGSGGGAGAGGVAGTGGTSGGGGAGGRGGAGGVAGMDGGAGVTGAGGVPVKDGGAAGSGGAAGTGADGGGAYMPCPTTGGTACAILPLGDSITEGCCTAPEGGYRIELFRQAVTNGRNITFVGSLLNGPTTVANRTFPMRHEGHGGYTISGGGNGGIAGTITDTAIATYHPNIVLLMIGTNDLNDNIDVTNAPTRLGKLIDEIITDAPAALVVVSSIIPIGAPNADQRTQTYNAAIPGLVNARASSGKHVVFVDNYAAFAKNANYQTTLKADGLHPNDAGYVLLGQGFYGAISGVLP